MPEPTLSDVMAALTRLEAGQTALRVEIMARMDRLQERMDIMDGRFRNE